MRTTLNLDDAAFQAASDYAAARAMKLGDAVSELVQRGFGHATASALKVSQTNGIAVFDLANPSKRKPATADLVKQLMED